MVAGGNALHRLNNVRADIWK